MFDQVKAISYAFAGELKDEETLRKYTWAFMVAIAFTFIILFYNSFMSLAFWKEQLEKFAGIDGATGAYIVTVAVAFSAYFFLASFTGTILDFIHKRTYRTEGHISMFIAVFLALTVLVWLDIHANLSGVTVVSHTTTQQVQQNTTDQKYDKVQAEIDEKETELKNLLAGNLGGYGWFDNAGKWHLNSSGKKYQRALSEDIKALRDSQKYLMDVAQQQYNDDKIRYTSTVQQKEANHTYLVLFAYPLALILSFFSNHFSDRVIAHVEGEKPVVQRDNAKSKPNNGNVQHYENLTETNLKDLVERYIDNAIENRSTNNSVNGTRSTAPVREDKRSTPNQNPIGYKSSTPAPVKLHGGGWEIVCHNCGATAVKKRSTAKYCSDKCRIEAYEKRNNTKFNKGYKRG